MNSCLLAGTHCKPIPSGLVHMPNDSPVPPADFEALRLHLARLRHEQGWSYNELSARSGVARSALVYLENGQPNRNPPRPATRGSIETWYKIARAFDVPLGDLLAPLYGPEGL